jgi:hypothetical protein
MSVSNHGATWKSVARLQSEILESQKAEVEALSARVEKLEELLSNIVLNAILTPDPSMGGAIDCYMVPIDDIEDARRAVTRA